MPNPARMAQWALHGAGVAGTGEARESFLEDHAMTSLRAMIVPAALVLATAAAGEDKKAEPIPTPIPPAKVEPPPPGEPVQTSIEGLQEVKTESGLKYWDIKVGEGPSPTASDKVQVHYSGWLADGGKLFDSSVQRGQPATFGLNQVIKGWTEGLSTMKVGGKRRLEVPPALGYGDKGRPPKIPGNATLIFEVELLKVYETPKQTSVEGITPVTTPSGLKYWDIKVGDGPTPSPGARVTVHYSGWRTDGYLFDSSVQRGQPATFGLNQVIKGWTEGVGSMKVGGKRRLEIPPDLGYGDKGQGRDIPPGATLIFEVELIKIE